ncbi:DMT family transporter [Paracoccus sp. (in: a-proteobacteria)]|uniref:DMT family transporter n=1 Tax=Paracoccus sp. TaxID=267 RepID=UPI003A836A90
MSTLIRAFLGSGAPLTPDEGQRAGIVLLLSAILCLTLMDAVAKHLMQDYSPALVVWARFVVNLMIMALIFRKRTLSLLRTRHPVAQFARSLAQLASVGLFFTSLHFIGLAEATAIMDLHPVLITLGAALFLGESIGPRRIAGIAAAMLGAMIIIRPGAGVFQPAALLPLAGAFSFAAVSLLTRAVRGDSAATSVLWPSVVGVVACSAILPWFWQPVSPGDLWAFALLGGFGTISLHLLVRAYAVAEAGKLAPFGYTGLIWAALWGWLIFGQLPDRWTIAGATIIVGAGIYVWSRERARSGN